MQHALLEFGAVERQRPDPVGPIFRVHRTQVGIVQSLLATCRLHDINPYDYLVDVLQRVGQHSASHVEELTPRQWKQRFAASPLRSMLHTFTT